MSYNTRNDVLAALKAGAVSLEQASALLEALESKPKGRLYAKVSAKGALSVYGLQRMPVTLYAEQWERLLGDDGRAVLADGLALPGLQRLTAEERKARSAAARETPKPAPAPGSRWAKLAAPKPQPQSQAYIELPDDGCYIGPFPSTAAAGEWSQRLGDAHANQIVTALHPDASINDILAPADAAAVLGITAA